MSKKQAYNFLKKFHISSPALHNLKEAIDKQGYTIIEYSHILNSDDVETLLVSLNLKEFSLTTQCFTFKNADYKLIFIKEGLSQDEQLILLAHEEGHIFCGHMDNNLNELSISNENEANLFASALLKQSVFREIRLMFAFHRTKILIGLSVVLIFAIMSLVGLYLYHTRANKYCITNSGDRYHLPNCEAVYDHNVIFGNSYEFKKLGRTPCNICLK